MLRNIELDKFCVYFMVTGKNSMDFCKRVLFMGYFNIYDIRNHS